MPQQDFIDSIKARLYDFKYTPFMSSFVFAWIYWNSKYILIFFSDKLSINEKINMLSYDSINHEYPFYFALFYVFVFPIATALFYGATLGYRLVMNVIQQKIQDKTPLPQIEANEIKKENANLRLELDEKIDEFNKAKKRFENKEQELLKNYDAKLEDDKKELRAQLNKQKKDIEVLKQAIKDFENKEKSISKVKINGRFPDMKMGDTVKDMKTGDTVKDMKMGDTVKDMKTQVVENVFIKLLDKFNENNQEINISKDEAKLLKVIYDNNIAIEFTDRYIKLILEKSNFKRIKIEALLISLTDKEILSSNDDTIDITVNGKKIILELFG